MIRDCEAGDFERLWQVVNDGARAYEGVIPADRYGTPYMTREKLREEIAAGVTFSGYEDGGTLVGVMGVQAVLDVVLVRHAYVCTSHQKQGIGAKLLHHLTVGVDRPILIGTWADAVWAIRFYERHGFQVVDTDEKNRLLKTYWKVPERQVETSVVLADQRWRNGGNESDAVS